MNECIFCKIISRRIPSSIVYEDEYVVSFLDIMPANKGHCLVVPKKHCENILEMEEKEICCMMEAVKKISKAVSLCCGNGSFNLIMNNGKDAGQIVMHAHLHIIPRFSKDRLRLKWSHKQYEGNEINELSQKIKKFV